MNSDWGACKGINSSGKMKRDILSGLKGNTLHALTQNLQLYSERGQITLMPMAASCWLQASKPKSCRVMFYEKRLHFIPPGGSGNNPKMVPDLSWIMVFMRFDVLFIKEYRQHIQSEYLVWLLKDGSKEVKRVMKLSSQSQNSGILA